MKRILLVLAVTLIATVANAQQINAVPFTAKGHAYLLFLVNKDQVAGTVHDPDCPNPHHIDNQFELYRQRQAPKQNGGLPQGHPPITPELRQQLKPKVQI